MSAENAIESDIRQVPPLQVDRPTAAKYRVIKDHLTHIARRHPVGARLPPIRTLSNIFNVANAPVHRAIAELCQEGVLVARQGSGTFIAASAHFAGDDPLVPLTPVVRQLRVQCAHTGVHHSAFWNRAVADYENDHPRVKILWHDNPAEQDPDLAEAVPHTWLAAPHEVLPWLDLRDFLLPLASDQSARDELQRCPYFATIHQTVCCMLVDLDRLKDLRVPPPTYRDCTGQLEYLERLTEHEAPGRTIVRSNVQPATWLGSHIESLISAIAADTSAGQQASISALDQLVCRAMPLMRPLIGHASTSVLEQFREREIPVMLTWSYFIGELRARKVPFRWVAYPLFAADDRICAVPASLGVNRRTAEPTECVRFLEHLRSPETQRRLLDQYLVRLHPGAEEASRLFTSDGRSRPPDWMTGVVKNLYQILIGSRREAYLYTNIINQELRECAKGAQTPSTTLSRIVALGRGYLRHFE